MTTTVQIRWSKALRRKEDTCSLVWFVDGVEEVTLSCTIPRGLVDFLWSRSDFAPCQADIGIAVEALIIYAISYVSSELDWPDLELSPPPGFDAKSYFMLLCHVTRCMPGLMSFVNSHTTTSRTEVAA